MESVRIRLKNYRAFTDQPAEFELRDGFTAFVGPNNGGKSSVLRMLYELRPVWTYIANHNGIIQLLRTAGPHAAIQQRLTAVEDPSAIFNNGNRRNLQIDVEILSSQHPTLPQIKGFSLEAERPPFGTTITWRIEFHWPTTRPQEALQNLVNDVWVSDSRPILDVGPILRVARALESTFYIGPFRNVLGTPQAPYFDMQVGSAFVQAWASWQTGPAKANNKAITTLVRILQKIFDLADLEITAAQDGSNLHVRINGEPYRLQELGDGFAQFVVTFGNALFAQKSLLLIDEPELGLHPSLQLDFLSALSTYFVEGTLFTTHSIGLARSSAEHIYAVQRTPAGCKITSYADVPNLTEFAGSMEYSSYAAIGCDTILLVEGVTEVRTVQQWLRLFKKEHRVVLIPLGGDSLARGGVAHELRELQRITRRVFALVDSERKSASDPPKHQRVEFENDCKHLGIPVVITTRRATENYLTDAAVKEAKGAGYRALQPYEALDQLARTWSKSDNWRIARCMNLSDIEHTDIGQLLTQL